MPKPLNTIEVYGAIQVNGKIQHRFDERMMLHRILIEGAKWMQGQSIESRDISTVEFVFSKRPIVDMHRTHEDGLEFAGVIPYDPSHDEDPDVIESKRREADPLYVKYMSILPKYAGDYTESELKFLRDHMERNYPEVTRHV